MAVAHSAASESHAATTGSVSQTSFSWTHTQTGTPQGVLVFVHVANSTGNPVSSVTYGGVTLERVSGGAAIDSAGEAGRTDLFFAGSGLGTGNQTVTVNRANTTDIMYASAATVTAATNTNVTGIVLLQGDGALTVQSVTDGGAPTNSLRYAAAYSGLAAPPPAGTGSTLLNSIDFGNYGIALVRETTAGTGARNVGFNNATTDDRAAVHVAVRELWNRADTETVGTFTLTGNDATFTKASPKEIAAETGVFTLTGQPADLLYDPNIEAGTGAFTLAGQPADARHNVAIEGGTGAFSLTGSPVTLTETTPKAITADTGAFTLTGNPAAVTRGYALTPEAGTFTATGQPATLRQNPRIEANTGSFALSGGAPAMLRGWYLSGGAGTFIETGQPATFRRTWAVQAATGAFAFTGNPASLTELGAYEIDPIAGSFTLAGQPATLAQSRTMPVDPGAFTLTGRPAATIVGHAITGETGKFFLPERNLHQRSEEFNNGYWAKGNSSVTANSTTAPDGTLTADTLIENTANATHIISRSLAFRTGVKYTASLYVKTYQNRDVALVLGTTAVFGGTGNTVVVFSPSTNTILLAGNSPEAFGAIDVGNGWYRIYVTKTAIASATVSGQIQLRIGTTGTYTGDGTSGAYIWGAQWQEGDLDDYDPTSANSAPLTDLRVAHRLVADTGAFSFTGNPATLAKTSAAGLAAVAGNFAFTGQPAAITRNRPLPADRGIFTLTGQPTALRQDWRTTGERGQFLLTGNPATLTATHSLLGGTGAFTFTGNPAGLADTDELAATTGAFLLSGLDATLLKASTARRRNVLIF